MAQTRSSSPPRVVELPADPAPSLAPSRTSQPTINEPRVTGGTPGRPFLFLIPASGDGPLTFAAKNLPAGLTLDSQTGIITGSLAKAGKTVVSLTVTGPKGTATSPLTIAAGDHALAQTPPPGWNSWNVWGGAVDAEKVRAAADAMGSTGLAAQGHQFINIRHARRGPRAPDGESTS